MKKEKKSKPSKKNDGMRSHYDFSKAEKANYAKQFSDGAIVTVHSSNGKKSKKRIEKVIILDDDTAAVFPDAKSVNTALRHLIAAMPGRRTKKAA